MNLQNQINQVLKKTRDIKQWLLTALESLDLKNRTIQLYELIKTVLYQSSRLTLKAMRYSKRVAGKTYHAIRTAFHLSTNYIARKKRLLGQWSVKFLRPGWNNFIRISKKLLLKIAGTLADIIKTIKYRLWQLLKYFFHQSRIFGIAATNYSKTFIIQAGIFFAYSGKKILYFIKVAGISLNKTARFSWKVFKRFLVLSYQYTRTALIVSGRTTRRLLHLSGKAGLHTLKLIDRTFKRTGFFITLLLCDFWHGLCLFGQGLLIIARAFRQLFVRSAIKLYEITKIILIAVDSGFKKTGFLLSLALIKSWQFFLLFIHLLMVTINQATETVLSLVVHGIRILFALLWHSVKFLIQSPVILLNAILPHALTNQLKQYALLIRLDKPIGILLLLWPTLIALWLAAEGWPHIHVLLVFVTGVILMRSAGCAINDYADRNIDSKVKRTQARPLASGAITVTEALVIFVSLSIMAFMLVLLMNGLTITMSFIGIILAASYPFMKRYTYIPQIHLGAAFGWAVPMAFAAQANELAPVAWLLFFATVLWATAYDTMYAMVDREDDILIGVKSTAILFEEADTVIIGVIQSLLILCLIMIGVKADLGGLYFLGVLIATGLAAWQQFLIKDRKPSHCFEAFMNNNWFGLVLFAGVFLEYQIGGISI